MQRICFISDTHLDASTPALNALFVDTLMTHASQANTVYLLGDIFEAWIGDDYQPEWLDPIKSALSSLVNQGIQVSFMVGNRDFLVGPGFLKPLGIELLEENHCIEWANQSLLLCHGDALCIDDIAYQEFRSMVRNPDWQNSILSQSVDTRLALAQTMRQGSQMGNANKSESIMDVNQNEVLRTMSEYNSHIMIHGHTHRPAHHVFQHDDIDSHRIVLGDWQPAQPSWLMLNSDGSGELVAHGEKTAVHLFENA